MVSGRFQGVLFKAYPDDHYPRHLHGFYGGVEVIVELKLDGTVALAARKDAIRPGHGKRADVRHVLATAAQHFEELAALWEEHYG
jgi:hypothetical protein